MTTPTLQTDFDDLNREDWQKLVEKGLRGAAFETLERRTEDGLQRGPLMTAADLPPEFAALARTDMPLLDGRPWHIGAPVQGSDLAQANQQLLENLKGGASAIRIENLGAIKGQSDLKRLLEGVYTDLVPIHFAASPENENILDTVTRIEGLSKAHLSLGLNPETQDMPDVSTSWPKTWKAFTLSPSQMYETGATDVQELAVLAAGLADAIRRHGATHTVQHLVIELSADRDAHMTIAKFRAARRIVLRIFEACNEEGTAVPLHAVTSLRMMQTTDAWTNLLRVMSAGFGAIVGGADVVTTRPFTDGLGGATPFAHRIARNMQLMMMEESHLGQVADAAHGSFWHEHMTDKLAQAAWRSFQEIEKAGGIGAWRDSGRLDRAMNAAKAARLARDEPILGVSLHPAKDVKTPEVLS